MTRGRERNQINKPPLAIVAAVCGSNDRLTYQPNWQTKRWQHGTSTNQQTNRLLLREREIEILLKNWFVDEQCWISVLRFEALLMVYFWGQTIEPDARVIWMCLVIFLLKSGFVESDVNALLVPLFWEIIIEWLSFKIMAGGCHCSDAHIIFLQSWS